MKGEKLTKAEEWFDRAVLQEEKGKTNMMNNCLSKALKYEQEGLDAGESY